MRIFAPTDGEVIQVVDLRGVKGMGIMVTMLLGISMNDSVAFAFGDNGKFLLQGAQLLPTRLTPFTLAGTFSEGIPLCTTNSDQTEIGADTLIIPSFADIMWARRTTTAPNTKLPLDVQIFKNGLGGQL